jgi:NAD(P)-dependent dehydrogenase (short-subunit alcohol dehydrogenase family)
MASEVWFITGASTGFGRALAEAVLARGSAVVATARKLESIADLEERYPESARTMTLDVDDHAAVFSVVDAAASAFGSIDVAVNNAGYALIGAFEEFELRQVRAQLETNFFGAWAVTQAVLPIMRARRGGAIVNISSQGGIVGMPGSAAYSASKFALEGMSEAVAAEVAPFGIRVLIVEPGPFRTDMRRRSLEITDHRVSDYPDYGGDLRRQDGTQIGDPRLAAEAIIAAVAAQDPPLRLVLGATAVAAVRAKLERASADLSAWEATSVATAFTDRAAE